MARKKGAIAKAMEIVMSGLTNRPCRRAISRIADQIDHASHSKRFDLMERIVTITLEEYILSGRPRNARDSYDLLMARLGDQALEYGDVKYLSRFFAPPVMEGMLSPEWQARNVLTASFYRYVGASLEDTLRFCRILFGAQATVIERYDTAMLKSEAVNKNAVVDHEKSPAPLICTWATTCQCDPIQAPQKLWFLQLLEAADRLNSEAGEFLRGVLWHVGFYSILMGKELPVISQSDFELNAPSGELERMMYFHQVNIQEPRVIVPDALKSKVERFFGKIESKTKRDLAQVEEFNNWFYSHREVIDSVFRQRTNAILTEFRRAIRPYGYDSVMVDLSPLRVVGITSFAFHTEGEHFPDVKLEVATWKSGSYLCRFWAYFRDFELQCTDHLFENWQEYDIRYLRSLLEFVVVDAMYRLVCSPPKRDAAKKEVDRKKITKREAKKEVVVRPFLRRLPDGWKASEEAIKLAFLECGWKLPDGVTYVQSHERWVGLPAEKPAPMFRYTDDDFKRSIEEA